MHIESFCGGTRLRLVLESVPLELWLMFDPGHPPWAVWYHADGTPLAAVDVVDA